MSLSYLSDCDDLVKDRILWFYMDEGLRSMDVELNLRVVCVLQADPDEPGRVQIRLVDAPDARAAERKMLAHIEGLISLCDTHPAFEANVMRLAAPTFQCMCLVHAAYKLVRVAIRVTPVKYLRESYCHPAVFNDMLSLSYLPEAFIKDVFDIMKGGHELIEDCTSMPSILTDAIDSGTTSIETVNRACNSLALLFGEDSFWDFSPETGLQVRPIVRYVVSESGAHFRLFVYLWSEFWRDLCDDEVALKMKAVIDEVVIASS